MTAVDSKPIPVPTAETRPFWEGCAAGTLLYQRCTACGHVQFPPRGHCVACRGGAVAWERSSGHGTVHSFTVVRRPPSAAFKDEVPYVIALVDLHEGFRMMMNVLGAAPDSVHIGQAVQIVFEDVGDGIALPQARIEE